MCLREGSSFFASHQADFHPPLSVLNDLSITTKGKSVYDCLAYICCWGGGGLQST